MAGFLASKLRSRGAVERLLRERLSEPLHLNMASALVALFGDHRAKVRWDLKFRQYTAFCLLDAADRAARLGVKRISAIEFGVASGGGLLNICENAAETSKVTGVEFDIYGFDTGRGLPPPRSYRDHPELYQSGDYPMDVAALQAKLPSNAKLVLGDIAETVPEFIKQGLHAPLGYVALDVDYYWSSVEALQILCGPSEQYLPLVNIYLDDCQDPYHNPACGEMLACEELNAHETFRKIYPYTALREKRLFKNASWMSKIWALHVLDHRVRTMGIDRNSAKVIANPYINLSERGARALAGQRR
jgi:hypothetical protein